jgi:integrase
MRRVEELAGRQWFDKHSGKRATVHGFRASLSTWGNDRGIDSVLIEVALAHAVGNAVERRYNRSDKLALRAEMMAQWAALCA